MPQKVRQRQNTLLRQRQIVLAAQEVILRFGSEHVTVRRIAEEVGISEGDIYRHFKSKRDILLFLADNVEQNLLTDLEQPRRPGSTPLEALAGVLKSHLSGATQRQGVSFQVIAEIISLGDKDLNNKVSAAIGRYTQGVKAILAEGVGTGEVRPDIDLDAAALMFFSMLQGVVNVWTLGNRSFHLEQRYQPLWDLFRETVAERKGPRL